MAIAEEADITRMLGFTGPDAPPEDVIHSCVHCGFCLPACPTYRETMRERSSPRGRIWLIRAVHEGRLDLRDQTFQEEMSLCLNCRACEAVCPSGVKYGELVESARAQIADQAPPDRGQSIMQRAAIKGVLGSPRRTRSASRALRLYQRSGAQKVIRNSGLLTKFDLDERESFLPDMSDEFIVQGHDHWPAQGKRRGVVALLAGCIMSTAFADVHRATARVLARNGFEVVVPPGQKCCGALSIHSGELEDGRELARKNIDAFLSREFDAVLSNSAGCGAAMREYDFLLRNDPAYAEKSRAFASQVQDVSEFLADRGLSVSPGELNERVTYQEPCHLAHAQRVTDQPRQLMRQVPGLELVEMRESSLCCGSAGIYNVLQPEMSRDLRERKIDHASATNPDVIVSANPGCMLQLRSGLRARGLNTPVEHIMTLLDRAYGGEPSEETIGNRTTARVPAT